MLTEKTTETTEEMRILKIRNGTVIDHIPHGYALEVVRILGILPGTDAKISLIMNTASKILGQKDIVKIEGRELTENETGKITVIAPDATINIIRNFINVEKYKVELPEIITGIITCSHGTCISNAPREPVQAKFRVISKKPTILVCVYCEAEIVEEDILKNMKL